MKLDQFQTITNKDYHNLQNPVFKGQTAANEKGEYWMCWESNGKYYKTFNFL